LNGAKRLNGWNDWNGLRYSNELHALSDDVCSSVFDQKMNVIGCHNVIEHTKSKALLRLRVLALNVLNGAERLNGWNVLELTSTLVRDVPDVSEQEIAVGAWHRLR
jgi:hypothetical protein